VCAKGIKKELNTLDEADLVRDVANRDYHHLSRFEIAGGRGLNPNRSGSHNPENSSYLLDSLLSPQYHSHRNSISNGGKSP
jgi:hypothetical protein